MWGLRPRPKISPTLLLVPVVGGDPAASAKRVVGEMQFHISVSEVIPVPGAAVI
jgi:hypothetical protein